MIVLIYTFANKLHLELVCDSTTICHGLFHLKASLIIASHKSDKVELLWYINGNYYQTFKVIIYSAS